MPTTTTPAADYGERHSRSQTTSVLSVLAGVFLMLLPILAFTAAPVDAATYQVAATGGSGVRQRHTPAVNSSYSGVAPEGVSFTIHCQQFVPGQAMGSYGNTLWYRVSRSGTGLWWINDTYTNTPRRASDPGLPGVPYCDAGTTSGGSGSSTTPIWIGAPYQGRYAGAAGGPPASSLPGRHAPVYTVPGYSYLHDWGMDFYAPAGTEVRMYAAPKNSALGSAITAQVIGVRAACKSGNTSHGGYVVFVGLFHSGVRVGNVAYSHVMPDFNRDGVTNAADTGFRGNISRWGGFIGRVGKFTYNDCWQVSTTAGHHLHIEMSNVRHFSCFRAMPAGSVIRVSEYMGYLGGAYASSRNQPCPTGA